MKKFGIDISEFQKGISFKKLKKSGVNFIMLRGAYTGSSDGVSKKVDSCFNKFYKKCVKYNIDVGCYYFSRATSYEKGMAEAIFLYTNCLKGRKFSYPICIDVEDSVYQAKASKNDITDAIKGFCSYLEKKGYYVMVYSNKNWFNNKIILKDIKRYDKWLACWTKNNPKDPSHGIWQFGGEENYIRSSSLCGFVVDQDYSYKDYPSIMNTKGLNGFKNETNRYKALYDMNIRSGPSIKYKIKKVKDIKKKYRGNLVSAKKSSNAVLKKGSIIDSMKSIIDGETTFVLTKYGYICLKDKKEKYLKEL